MVGRGRAPAPMRLRRFCPDPVAADDGRAGASSSRQSLSRRRGASDHSAASALSAPRVAT
eukprot:2901611-Alexandrium_andersonii.AAC.1